MPGQDPFVRIGKAIPELEAAADLDESGDPAGCHKALERPMKRINAAYALTQPDLPEEERARALSVVEDDAAGD